MKKSLISFTSRMDNLYEFDREPVPPEKLQSGGRFAGLFAGEHAAATEFVIATLFVTLANAGPPTKTKIRRRIRIPQATEE